MFWVAASMDSRVRMMWSIAVLVVFRLIREGLIAFHGSHYRDLIMLVKPWVNKQQKPAGRAEWWVMADQSSSSLS
uniref:Uncharacterized protein n=1 Tax=Podoviridae sp. ctRnx2 TaxID=2826555 RepID=A0A8S5QTJ8_9CAUD|nr:MAG TPA: hypothetical protein [Podoviridae sp. ctRnx2]